MNVFSEFLVSGVVPEYVFVCVHCAVCAVQSSAKGVKGEKNGMN